MPAGSDEAPESLPTVSDSPSHRPHVVVHPVIESVRPYRRVEILGAYVGKAHCLGDITTFCLRFGMHGLDLEAADTVLWLGGGSRTWMTE